MRRSDGRRVKTIAPFAQIIPYIMTTRNDATNMTSIEFPYAAIMNYINTERKKGRTELSMLASLIAAYIRTLSKYPELNRFCIAKKVYARYGIWTSFVTLKDDYNGTGERPETVVKILWRGDETIQEVSEIVNSEIERNRKPSNSNNMDNFIRRLFSIPILPSFLVACIRGADKLGLLPKAIIKLSPFHTSIFFSNMASIRANPIYHHLYNFGSTSAFISLGIDIGNRKKYNMKIATDERICSGSSYVVAMRYFLSNLNHPEALETPPDEVKSDIK